MSHFVLLWWLCRGARSRVYSARNIFCPPPLSHHPAEAQSRQRPRLCCLRDLFSHISLSTAAVCVCGWEHLKCHYSLPSSQRHYQRCLSMKVRRIIDTFCPGITESPISCHIHSAVTRVSWELWINLWLTFFHGACCHGFAVRTLELIEIRAHLNLIDNSFLQAGESYVPLRGDLQVLYLPRSWGGQAWGLPEKNAVALNKLRWILHLREEAKESGI